MPYRLDIPDASDDVLDRLVELGAIDADASLDGGLAALMPDRVTPEEVARILGIERVAVSPARGRDDDSTWTLSPRALSIGRLRILPAGTGVGRGGRPGGEFGVVVLGDSPAFGTGLHPTTALCLEAIDDALSSDRPTTVLDVGTGTGVLALAALSLGVPRALGIDIDRDALRAAADNARVNGVEDRLQVSHGSPDAITGSWPLVLANVQAAPLIEMAPVLVRRVAHHGQLVLSGIATSVEPDVYRVYSRLGMVRTCTMERAGWVAIVLRATW